MSSLTLALVLTAGTVLAGEPDPASAVGTSTPLGRELLRERGRVPLESPLAAEGAAWSGRLVYINTQQEPSPVQLSVLQGALQHGAWILLDGSASSPERQSSVSGRLGGLALGSPVILIRRGVERTHYVPFQLAPPTGPPALDAESGAMTAGAALPKSARSYADPRLVAAIDETLARPLPADAALPAGAALLSEGGAVPYRPQYSFDVTTRYVNFSCWLPEKLQGYVLSGSYKDFCRGAGVGEIIYHVDLIRSIAAGGGSEDAKYVRVWVSADRGGTGWHLANDIEQIHTWFESWAHRDESLGPVADKYKVRVYSADPLVQLAEHAPAQTSPTSRIVDTRGLTVGATGELAAEVSNDGPKIGGKAGGSFSYRNERSIAYDSAEYTIENNAGFRPNGAEWVWNRRSQQTYCDWLTSQSAFSCTMVGALWDTNWVVRKSAFGAIGYANFVPGILSVFKVPGSRSGVSRFWVESSVTAMAVYAKVLPSIVYWAGDIRALAYTDAGTGTWFDVNWDSPVFEPDAHVRLQSLDIDVCLDVYGGFVGEGVPVIGWPCKTVGRANQTWGFDGEERYRSRVAPNRCLAVDTNNAVVVRACDLSLRQKWYWSGDKLYSRAPGTQPLALSLHAGTAGGINYEWAVVAPPENATTNWKPYYVLPEP